MVDNFFKYEVRLGNNEDDFLAAYMAEHGAANWKQIVKIIRTFGRVFELWKYDIGIGSIDPQYDVVR